MQKCESFILTVVPKSYSKQLYENFNLFSICNSQSYNYILLAFVFHFYEFLWQIERSCCFTQTSSKNLKVFSGFLFIVHSRGYILQFCLLRMCVGIFVHCIIQLRNAALCLMTQVVSVALSR